VANAEARGAVGVIIYSDPGDDGFGKGRVYPDGPWRPEHSVQRGSVYTGEGDPLTPGYAATKEALRLSLEDASDPAKTGMGWALSKIPSLPISYADAGPILKVCDVCPQLLFALNYCLPSTTVRPQLLFALNNCSPSTTVCPQLTLGLS
jgi:hypothetical protein